MSSGTDSGTPTTPVAASVAPTVGLRSFFSPALLPGMSTPVYSGAVNLLWTEPPALAAKPLASLVD